MTRFEKHNNKLFTLLFIATAVISFAGAIAKNQLHPVIVGVFGLIMAVAINLNTQNTKR